MGPGRGLTLAGAPETEVGLLPVVEGGRAVAVVGVVAGRVVEVIRVVEGGTMGPDVEPEHAARAVHNPASLSSTRVPVACKCVFSKCDCDKRGGKTGLAE